jgi:integrase
VLGLELPWLDDVESAKAPKRLPVVLNGAEVMAALARLDGTNALIARLLYGTGLRIMECLRLRVKDVDFERGEILVRDGKGFKDRVTMLPASLMPALREQLERASPNSTDRTWRRGMARYTCPLRWIASIRRRDGNGPGSTCFRR